MLKVKKRFSDAPILLCSNVFRNSTIAIVILAALVVSGDACAQSASEIAAQGVAAILRKDYPEALRLNLKAAELGDARAQTNVGALFHNGDGVERNYREAMKWYRMGAKGGDVQAEKNIGDLYVDMSVPEICRDHQTGEVKRGCYWIRDLDAPNDIEAVKWYLRASEKGHAGAMANLGRMFALGHGVKQNCAVARKWLGRAAGAGNQAAKDMLSDFADSCRW